MELEQMWFARLLTDPSGRDRRGEGRRPDVTPSIERLERQR